MLPGTDFLEPCEANIDYSTDATTFGKIEDPNIPFTADPNAKACKRIAKDSEEGHPHAMTEGRSPSPSSTTTHFLPSAQLPRWPLTMQPAIYAVADAKKPKHQTLCGSEHNSRNPARSPRAPTAGISQHHGGAPSRLWRLEKPRSASAKPQKPMPRSHHSPTHRSNQHCPGRHKPLAPALRSGLQHRGVEQCPPGSP